MHIPHSDGKTIEPPPWKDCLSRRQPCHRFGKEGQANTITFVTFLSPLLWSTLPFLSSSLPHPSPFWWPLSNVSWLNWSRALALLLHRTISQLWEPRPETAPVPSRSAALGLFFLPNCPWCHCNASDIESPQIKKQKTSKTKKQRRSFSNYHVLTVISNKLLATSLKYEWKCIHVF